MSSIRLFFPFRAMTKDNEKLQGAHGRPYTSKKFKDFEKQVGWEARIQYKGEIIEYPISIELNFFYTSGIHPDLPNLPKSICDALQGIVYKNDRQIKKLSMEVKSAEIDTFEVFIKEFSDLLPNEDIPDSINNHCHPPLERKSVKVYVKRTRIGVPRKNDGR